MKCILAGKPAPKACQIDYRPDERMWIFPEAKEIKVTFEVNFTSDEDRQLGRIFLLELNDSKRQVMNAPSI